MIAHTHAHRRLVTLLCLFNAAPVLAQPNTIPDTNPPIDEVLEWLDSPVFAARDQALRSLFERRDIDLATVESWLDREGLTPEQRLRLDALALQIFARGPRAALGISFPPDDRGGVRIVDVVPEFPAADILEPGDHILIADGVTVTRQATLRAAILSHAPGETLHLTVERDGETREFAIPLRSFRDLRGGASPRVTDLYAAWMLRRSRAADPSRVSAIVPDRQQPDGDAAPLDPGSGEWIAFYTSGDAPGGLVVGGQPRETGDLSLTRLAALDASRGVTLEDPEIMGDADLVLQLTILRNERARSLEDITRLEQLVTSPHIDAGNRIAVRQQLELERERLGVLEEQIRRVDETRRLKP